MTSGKIAAGLIAALMGCALGSASAKLPALTDEQKATAEAAKAKADEAAKKEGELLGKYQDRAAENYRRAKVQKTAASATRKP